MLFQTVFHCSTVHGQVNFIYSLRATQDLCVTWTLYGYGSLLRGVLIQWLCLSHLPPYLSFSRSSWGSSFELEALMNSLPLQRLLFRVPSFLPAHHHFRKCHIGGVTATVFVSERESLSLPPSLSLNCKKEVNLHKEFHRSLYKAPLFLLLLDIYFFFLKTLT